MSRPKKPKTPALKPGDETEVPGAARETDLHSPAGLNTHEHVGKTCRYTNAGGYVRAAIVEGVDADGYRLAIFDPIERCVRHEHGVKAESLSPAQ